MTKKHEKFPSWRGQIFKQQNPCFNNEACIGVIGIQDICHSTSRDIGYYPFYFQGYRILCSISGILCFFAEK